MNCGLPVNLLLYLYSKTGIANVLYLRQMEHGSLRYVKIKLWSSSRRCSNTIFFLVYIDDIIETVAKQQIGCVHRSFVVSIILYTDDILLLAPSIDSLQKLFNLC